MKSNLTQALQTRSVDMQGKYFLPINDNEKSYIVQEGTGYAHVFCWIFDNGQATSNKRYLGSFHEGEVILGGQEYAEQNTTCGLYAILEHNTVLHEVETTALLALNDAEAIAKIDYFLASASSLLVQPLSQNYQIQASLGEHQALEKTGDIIAPETDNILWLSANHVQALEADGTPALTTEELAPYEGTPCISKTLYATLYEQQSYTCKSSSMLLEEGHLITAIQHFDNWLKENVFTQLRQMNQERQDNFSYLQNIQNSHLHNTFSQLFDSYFGNKNITPESVVIDENLGINRIIGQLCRLFDIQLKESACKTIERLDYNNHDELENALGIYRIQSREVILEKGWEKKEQWTLIARLKETQQTILLSNAKKGYQYFDAENNTWNKVTPQIAQSIEEKASMLYRPLPEEPIKSGFDLFKRSLFLFKSELTTVIITGLLIGITNLVTPIIIGKLLSEALPSNELGIIYGFLLAMLCAAFGVAIFQFVNSISMIRIESKSSLDIHSSIWSRLMQLPISFFDKYSVGDLSDRANTIESIYSIWSAAVTSAILSIFSIITTIGLLFYYSPSLATVSCILLVLVLFIVYVFLKSVMPIVKDVYLYKGIINNTVFQILNGISKFRIASKENTMLSLWSNVYNKIVVNNRKYMLHNATMQTFFQALPLLSSIIIFAFTYYFLHQQEDNNFSLGDFISFNTAFGQLTGALISISSILSSVIMIQPMIQRIMPILEAEVEPSNNKVMIDSLSGNIEMNQVSFQYDPSMPLILDNLSIKIESGDYIAIVGSSGSGKSTIMRLLLGFEKCQSGSILVDGININDIEISSLRKHIGPVLQNGNIIPGSIKENITAGNNTINEKDIWDALKKAGIYDEVKKMPMGIHTIISESGSSISGGQLQRLIIARALATKPSMMFLDEATSAMDNIVQRQVQNTLEDMNITRIVIAHRLSTIINADRIYVLDKGKIVEQGNYTELMQQKGHFAELVARQQ